MALADSFARDARLGEVLTHVKLVPMGTAVLANSSWPLNRQRLAELLGLARAGRNCGRLVGTGDRFSMCRWRLRGS